MANEKKFEIIPQLHGPNLERIGKAVGRLIEENERIVMTRSDLTTDEVMALHKNQVELANTYQWLQNIRMKYFPPRIQGANGQPIIGMQ